MVRIGTSGWSYPSWRPGFYPDGMQPAEFLGFYAERFDSVKFALRRLDRVTTFFERVLALGDRLGPVRIVYEGPRDEGTRSFVEGSTPEGIKIAWDFRDES